MNPSPLANHEVHLTPPEPAWDFKKFILHHIDLVGSARVSVSEIHLPKWLFDSVFPTGWPEILSNYSNPTLMSKKLVVDAALTTLKLVDADGGTHEFDISGVKFLKGGLSVKAPNS